jgi:hypothetical protein
VPSFEQIFDRDEPFASLHHRLPSFRLHPCAQVRSTELVHEGFSSYDGKRPMRSQSPMNFK